MGFPRQEYWNGLLSPAPRDLPDPETETASPTWTDFLGKGVRGIPDASSRIGRKEMGEKKVMELQQFYLIVRIGK